MTTKESAAIPTLRDDIRGALIASVTGHGSRGPNYDGNKLAGKLEAILAASAATQPVPGPILSDEREAFEIAMLPYVDLARDSDDSYKFSSARQAWTAWQARAAISAVPGQSEPVAAPKGVTLEAFQAAHDKQWRVVIKHPFGKSWVRMENRRDLKLAELIAAQPAPVSAAPVVPAYSPKAYNELCDIVAPFCFGVHMVEAVRRLAEEAKAVRRALSFGTATEDLTVGEIERTISNLTLLAAPAGATSDELQGYKLVPLEPTPEMLEAAQALDGGNDDVMAAWSDAYSAMLDAAPDVTAPAGPVVARPDLRKVLIDVRNSLQFANDSPGGGISDTLWMMDAPETIFDHIDAAIASAPQAPDQSTGEAK